MTSYVSTLLAVLAYGLLVRRWALVRAASVLLGNWSVLTVFATLTSDQYCIAMNATVDYLSILALWMEPRSRGATVIVITYALGMIFHSAAAFRLSPHWQYTYWYEFYYLAWTQAALLVTWGSIDGGRRVARWNRTRDPGLSLDGQGALVARCELAGNNR